MSEKVLLTGISGFIAKHVAIELLNSGYDGDRTSTAGSHRHGINVGPSYRGETETRATNVALKICIKY